MSPEQIKEKIDNNNDKIESLLTKEMFVLNEDIKRLIAENLTLQTMCSHEFENGICKYCYLEQK